jgi:hypothetical protein
LIYIEDTEEGRKFATIAKLITPSEDTENKIFIDAESFVSDVQKGKDFKEEAKEKNYVVKYAMKIKKRDTQIPGLEGSNSHIVSWAFNDDTQTGDVKRFQLDKAYVVVQVINKQKEGLMNIKDAADKVKPRLLNDKKAEILMKKLQDGTLDEIAQKENTTVYSTGDISIENPNRALLGQDNNAVIGAMLSLKEGETYRGIKGLNAVYAVELLKKTPPMELDSYEAIRRQIASQITINSNNIFEALKELAEIKDYR